MIDYVKIYVKDSAISYLEENEKLEFVSDLNQRTGEVSQKKEAEYHFCKITIYESGSVYFTGSIHKLWNSLNNVKAPNYRKQYDKGFNGNVFALKDVFEKNVYSLLRSTQRSSIIIATWSAHTLACFASSSEFHYIKFFGTLGMPIPIGF